MADREDQLNSTFANAALKGRLSAALLDQLRKQLNEIDSAEAATIWARSILPAKNSLSAAEARQLEDDFRAKLEQLNDRASDKELSSLAFGIRSASGSSDERQRPTSMRTSIGERIDKSELAHFELRRIRDREHVRFVAKQPCLICGRLPSDPHHVRFAQHPALGRKVSDEFTVPLCRGHHREAHGCGDEAAWWQNVGIDPSAFARTLWLKTHSAKTYGEIRLPDHSPSPGFGEVHLKPHIMRARPLPAGTNGCWPGVDRALSVRGQERRFAITYFA